ncbi:MAG: AAA family ATPase [Deltaproteobacteria bacterium]|nr:AAA family ATPase [Deltaproteobacteria bacterium]
MICPKCQTEIPGGANFCPQCGHGLKADAPTPQPYTTSEPERRHVTALFSDLTGYTALTERLDPEQVKEITGQVFAGVKGIISKYEGFIDRLLGDGVLAFFGIPKAHEDDPIRAIRAAMEIHDIVKALSPKYEGRVGAPLIMHSGINTGLVVTAEVDPGKGSQGVTGDPVNLAARLSGLAGPGEILAGEQTVRRARERFEFQDLGTKLVKGKTEPIAVYKLISSKDATSALDRQVSSVMVGRDQEMNRLELQMMKVINGEGSVVNIIGEAGIGKSRLMAELRRHQVMLKVALLEGRAISIGRNLSFHPLVDLLKQWTGISEEDPGAVAFGKLDLTIRSIHPEEADEILPFVATLMGMKLTGKHAERVRGIEGEALEKLIFKNLRELLIQTGKQVPLVIVMEDLHWADTSSLLLLQSLFRLAEKYRILFINLFRPGYWQGEDRSMEKIGELLPDHYVELNMQPLDLQSGEALIENLLNIPGLPSNLRQQIIERSGGNPFFIEEVVRSLIDERVIIRSGGSFAVTDKINSVVVPPTINDVLIARIDRIEEKTRELIKVASVIGRNFFDRLLKEVATHIEGIDNRLSYLKDLQLIRDRIRMEELEYFFKHALAQEAAYESILLQQRKGLHFSVAQSIEKLFSERLHEFYALLAFHYSKADDLEKAEEWLIKAGEEALRSSASSEALHFYREALKLYLDKHGAASDQEKVAQLKKNIAFALFSRARYLEALDYYYQVLEHFNIKIPRYQLMDVHKILWDWVIALKSIYFPKHLWKGVPKDQTDDLCKTMIYLGMSISIPNPRAFFIACVPYAIKWLRKFDVHKLEFGSLMYIAISCGFAWGSRFNLAEKMLKIIKAKTDLNSPVKKLYYKTTELYLNFLKGIDWEKGAQDFGYDDDLIDQNIGLGQIWWAAMTMLYYAMKKIEQGDFQFCIGFIKKIESIGIRFDHPHVMVIKYQTEVRINIKRHFYGKAIDEANQGISLAKRTDVTLILLSLISLKTSALVLLGHINEAIETIKEAHRINAQTEILPVHLGDLFNAQALIDLARLDQAITEGKRSEHSQLSRKAAKSIKRCLKNAKKAASYLTEALRLKGHYYRLNGDDQRALTWWSKAIQEGERLGARPDLARTYFEVGKILLGSNNQYRELSSLSAQEYLDKAEKLFREMDLQWDLEQLVRVRQEH